MSGFQTFLRRQITAWRQDTASETIIGRLAGVEMVDVSCVLGSLGMSQLDKLKLDWQTLVQDEQKVAADINALS